MKFAVKMLLLGATANAVKLNQKESEQSKWPGDWEWKLAHPGWYSTWGPEWETWAGAPECTDCEEKVAESCWDVHEAEAAKKAAAKTAAAAHKAAAEA